MNYLQVLILAVIQGMAELLPVSSSAHVIVAEKLMGLDPSRPGRCAARQTATRTERIAPLDRNRQRRQAGP